MNSNTYIAVSTVLFFFVNQFILVWLMKCRMADIDCPVTKLCKDWHQHIRWYAYIYLVGLECLEVILLCICQLAWTQLLLMGFFVTFMVWDSSCETSDIQPIRMMLLEIPKYTYLSLKLLHRLNIVILP